MPKHDASDQKLKEIAALLQPSPELLALLRSGAEEAERSPERARQFYVLINSLPGKFDWEQRQIVEQALALFSQTANT